MKQVKLSGIIIVAVVGTAAVHCGYTDFRIKQPTTIQVVNVKGDHGNRENPKAGFGQE